MKDIIASIITSVLTALYQPFWFSVILSVLVLFFIFFLIIMRQAGEESGVLFQCGGSFLRAVLFFENCFSWLFIQPWSCSVRCWTGICGWIHFLMWWETGGSGNMEMMVPEILQRSVLRIWCCLFLLRFCCSGLQVSVAWKIQLFGLRWGRDWRSHLYSRCQLNPCSCSWDLEHFRFLIWHIILLAEVSAELFSGWDIDWPKNENLHWQISCNMLP